MANIVTCHPAGLGSILAYANFFFFFFSLTRVVTGSPVIKGDGIRCVNFPDVLKLQQNDLTSSLQEGKLAYAQVSTLLNSTYTQTHQSACFGASVGVSGPTSQRPKVQALLRRKCLFANTGGYCLHLSKEDGLCVQVLALAKELTRSLRESEVANTLANRSL